MNVQTTSNQTIFQGKAHFAKDFKHIYQEKTTKLLDDLSFKTKPYDLYLSNSAITAKRPQDINNPSAPRVTTIISKKDSISALIKSTMENFECILDNLKTKK